MEYKEIIHILQIRKYVVFNDKAIMPVSLTNSIDIVANSVSICDEDSVDDIFYLFLQKTDAIQQIVGLPPETLNTLHKIAEHINNDGTSYNTLTSQLNTKASSSDVNSA